MNALHSYAVAIAGEQAKDFAYEHIVKFRPGGANYRRLRHLQTAGEALEKQPALYAAAPEMLAALENAHGVIYEALNRRGGKLALSRALIDICNVLAKAKGEVQS